MGSVRSEIGLPHGSTLKVRLVWPRLIKHLFKSYGPDTKRGELWLTLGLLWERRNSAQTGGRAELIHLVLVKLLIKGFLKGLLFFPPSFCFAPLVTPLVLKFGDKDHSD